MCEECIIGIWSEYSSYDLITYNDLKVNVKEYNDNCDLFNRVWNVTEYKNKTIQDFLDRRKSSNLIHFNNCPYCGKKIDWKELRKLGGKQ